jgi:hypothetical protein
MIETMECRWEDVSSGDDLRAHRRRWAKTFLAPGSGKERVVKLEVVTENTTGRPPEDTFTDEFYDWLEQPTRE